ncbi:MAG TPA: S8 family serine peptidase, partial [Nitrospirota bacterium]
MKCFILSVLLTAASLFVAGISFGQGIAAPNHSHVGLKNFPFESIESGKGEPALPPTLMGKRRADGKGFVIVKFRSKDNEKDRARLSGKGIRFTSYVPVDSFLAKVPAGMRDMLIADPAVEAVFDYRPAYKLEKRLLDSFKSGKKDKKKLIALIFEGEDVAQAVQRITAVGGTAKVISDRPGTNGKAVEVELTADKLAQLAEIDEVRWVQESRTPVLHNDLAAPVIKSDYCWNLPAPLTGTGQIVAICDTGLDTGNFSTLNADFKGQTSDNKSKVKAVWVYGGRGTGDWSDSDGHGTHTTGSLAGMGIQSNILQPGTFVKGTAWDSQVVFQSVLNSSGGLSIPMLDLTLFPNAYDQGARIHSNSWGYTGSYGNYDYYAAQVDSYAWNNKDFLPLFSAGNDGADTSPSNGYVDPGSVSSPSTAKDVLCVGASENNRPSIATKYGTAIPGIYLVQPINQDRMADNANGMAAFSGRGPCDDGRIKPDIVAPGTYVLSVKSSLSPASTLASKYGYPSSFNTYYTYMSGTSMATPLTAGAAALVREYLANSGFTNPSAALVKGLLIAGAKDLKPGQYGSVSQPPDTYAATDDVRGRPDGNQGWGRVDLQESLYPTAPKRMWYEDHASGLATGGSYTYNFSLVNSTVPVRVNLVWTDYPGTSGVSPNLVNDLDLVVTTADGHTYHGNRYAGSVSIADDPAFDRLNNVEGVTIPVPASGNMTVTVQGYTIPNGPQPYAIMVSGALGTPPVVTGVSPSSGINNTVNGITVTGSNFAAGAAVSVGSISCQVGSVASGQIQATVPAGLAAGAYAVRVTNPDGLSGSLAAGYTSVQDTTVPATPTGVFVSPADKRIAVAWKANPEPDVTGYRVIFGNASTSVGKVVSTNITGLTNGQNYPVTLRAVDVAGNASPASAPVSATPSGPVSDLPHYNWDASPNWLCANCHQLTRATFLPPGYSYGTDAGYCLSCHNTASNAHGKAVNAAKSHSTLVNYTAGKAHRPTYGTVTSGEYSDTMWTHLKDGKLVVCTTCHNAMRKPSDVGRAWEYTPSSDGKKFKAYKGGFWDRAYQQVRAAKDSTLWTPTYSKDRANLTLDQSAYSFNEYSGSVVFQSAQSGYVYLTLDDPYLRVPGSDNTICTDCHAETTHKAMSCLSCHGSHNLTNIAGIRSKVRRPGGTAFRDVVFKRFTGINSFAGSGTLDGICEVCHAATLYYRADGMGQALHQDGQNYN